MVAPAVVPEANLTDVGFVAIFFCAIGISEGIANQLVVVFGCHSFAIRPVCITSNFIFTIAFAFAFGLVFVIASLYF